MDDRKLLREFAATRCERAFAQLVGRHLDLVYSAAKRQVSGNATLAEDVAQGVFVLLAEKAATIRDGEALAGWLLVTTRYVALNTLRTESRRRRHEREAAEMKCDAQEPTETPAWETIGPLLDEAVANLKGDDRDALVLRYFEGRSAAEVAEMLGISSEAAQKRLTRSVERLRAFFRSRGIATSPQGLATALSANACVAAPALLAMKICSDALSAATTSLAAAGASPVAGKATAAIVATTKAKVLLLTVGGALLLGVTGTIAHQRLTGPSNGLRVVTVTPPAAATVQPDAQAVAGNDWIVRFRAVYSLGDGEVLRHVRPPFIPERMDFYRGQPHGDAQLNRRYPNGPDRYVLEDNGATLNPQLASYGDRATVLTAMSALLGARPYDLDLPAQVLNLPLPGDFVVRAGTTQAERATALSPLLSPLIGRSVSLTQKMMQREVIVVSGTFRHRPLEGMPAPAENLVYLFRGPPPPIKDVTWSQVPLEMVLRNVASLTNRPIIVKGSLDQQLQVSLATNSSLLVGLASGEEKVIDELLALVKRQTSLDLRRAPRTLPTWTLEEQAR